MDMVCEFASGSMENFPRLVEVARLLIAKRATTGYLCCGANNIGESIMKPDIDIRTSRSTSLFLNLNSTLL